MTTTRITHVGGPTVLIEVGGWRLVTDPTLDSPGRRYTFGWGSSSRKLAGPAAAAADVGWVDAVLLSHHDQGDNLDIAGRALLPAADVVVTAAAVLRAGAAVGDGPQHCFSAVLQWRGTTGMAPAHRRVLPFSPEAGSSHRDSAEVEGSAQSCVLAPSPEALLGRVVGSGRSSAPRSPGA